MSNEQTLQEMARRINLLEYHIENLQTFEFSNNLDPYAAEQKTINFLNGRRGVRWIGNGMNANYAANAPVGSLTLNNATSANPVWDIDSDYGHTHLNLEKTTHNQYLSNYYSAWGLWGVDSGVYTWSSSPGMVAGAWINLESYTTPEQGIISAWNPYSSDPNYGGSWRLLVDTVTNTDKLRCSVSSTGSYTVGQEELSSVDVPLGRWVFCVMRWLPSTSIDLWLFDGDDVDHQTNTTSIVSDLYDSRYFYLGAYKRSTGAIDSFDGRIGVSFFHVTGWDDFEIYYLHQISRSIYGV